MFTAAIILMEMKRPRVTRPPYQKNDAISRIRDLHIPGEHYVPPASYSKKSGYPSRDGRALRVKKTSTQNIPSEFFCESLHTMHDNDQAGLALVSRTPPNMKSTTTTSSTTAVVSPVPVSVAKKVHGEDGIVDGKGKEIDAGHATEGRCHPGIVGCHDDGKSKQDIDVTNFGEDGDRLAALQDEITTKKDKRRLVLEQILKLEEKKRRFIRTTRLNQGKLRVTQRKRAKLENLAQSKVHLRWQHIMDLEKEKVAMEEKLERLEDIGIALAMQKEEKHRSLLETIDNAPALYRKESELLEERHQREVVRYQVVMGLFLALFALLLITYISRFGVTEKSATSAGMFY